jgi:single-strand DNA-binding protein
LFGNLGKKPEIRVTQNGMKIASLRMATSQKVKEEWVSTWHTVKAFGKNAERVEHIEASGWEILVIGKLELEKWKDKQGQDKERVVIIADVLRAIPKENSYHPAVNASNTPPSAAYENYSYNDDVPF